jgi:hypothetical protein
LNKRGRGRTSWIEGETATDDGRPAGTPAAPDPIRVPASTQITARNQLFAELHRTRLEMGAPAARREMFRLYHLPEIKKRATDLAEWLLTVFGTIGRELARRMPATSQRPASLATRPTGGKRRGPR